MKIINTTLVSLFGFSLLLTTPVLAKPSVNQAQSLKAHNIVRARDKQRPLQWSADLENISQQWANQLASSCKMYHHKGDIPFGENLFISSAPTTINHAVTAWANEKNFYNHPQNKCQPGKQCGHYTQIVWKGTTDVGCAMKSCSNGSQIYVCSYFPGGNIVGARPF
ncbi:MAG: CAP domain-containing protein [Cocleimonas sp.]